MVSPVIVCARDERPARERARIDDRPCAQAGGQRVGVPLRRHQHRCVETEGAIVERRAGDAAVIDVHHACTGRVGKLCRVVVPCLPRREVGVYEYAQLAGLNGLIGSPSSGDGDERFGPEQTEVQPIIARTGPRHRRVESAVEDTPDLNVTGHDPFVDAKVQWRGRQEIIGKPTDVTDPERTRRSREPAPRARRELEHLACVG
jgi:hypothetical protein